MLLCETCISIHNFPYISLLSRNHGECDHCKTFGHHNDYPSVYDIEIELNNDKLFGQRGFRMDYATDCMGNEILVGDVIAYPSLAYGSSTVTTEIAKVMKVGKSGAWKPKFPFYLTIRRLYRDRTTGKFKEGSWQTETVIRKLSNVAILNVANEIDLERRAQ